jgi:hypothetical protein
MTASTAANFKLSRSESELTFDLYECKYALLSLSLTLRDDLVSIFE